MTSHPWRPVPLFRLLVPYLAGVIPVIAAKDCAAAIITVVITCWLIAACFVFVFQPKYLRWHTIQGSLLQLLLIIQGGSMVYLNTTNLRLLHYTKHHDTEYLIMITEQPVERKKSFRATGQIIRVIHQNTSCAGEGLIQLYFSKDSSVKQLKYGDCIYARLRYDSLPAPPAAEGFNYRDFMSRRQVYARGFLSPSSWIISRRKEGSSLMEYSLNIKCALLKFLHQRLGYGQEYAVAAALLIGEVETIDPALMKAFAATGTLHVLSVSGMHVGLIYMLLASLLGRMEEKKSVRWIYFTLLFIFLWGYAMITGLSAPVIRSAVMLSLVLTGKILRRKSPVLNTLCGSVLLMLMYNPFWLAETGFQLSYLAVTGIMVIHPLLVHKIEFERVWMHKIWELISVSFCAQVITVPVTLLFFRQFPVYFLFSNLLIIPLSTLTIYGGIATLVSLPVPYAGSLIATAETYLLKGLNALTFFLGELPGATIRTPPVSMGDCLMMYALLLGVLSWMVNRKASQLMALMALLILWSLQKLI